MTEEEQLQFIKEKFSNIQYVKNPTEKAQWTAVKGQVHTLQLIENPSIELQLYAAKKDGSVLQYLKNPTYEVQKEALKTYGFGIEYIKNPSEEFKKLAITQNPCTIMDIKEPSEELQIMAVKADKYSFGLIKEPTIKVIFEFFSQNYTKDLHENMLVHRRKDMLFENLIDKKKISFLDLLPQYREILQEEKYYKAMLLYLIKFHQDWVKEFEHILSPLTKEQEIVWKSIRLKTVL